jgi:hypothetical protein
MKTTMKPEEGLPDEDDDGARGRSSNLTPATPKIPRNPPKMTPEMHIDLGVVPPLS